MHIKVRLLSGSSERSITNPGQIVALHNEDTLALFREFPSRNHDKIPFPFLFPPVHLFKQNKKRGVFYGDVKNRNAVHKGTLPLIFSRKISIGHCYVNNAFNESDNCWDECPAKYQINKPL